MTTTDSDLSQHPLLAVVAVAAELQQRAAEAELWSLSDTELQGAVTTLTRFVAGMEATLAGVLAEVDHRELAVEEGHHDTASWFAIATNTTRPAAKATMRRARSLAELTHTTVRAALLDGRLVPEQADVIITSIDRLAAAATEFAINADQIEAAERHLVDLAAIHDARELRILGNRIVEVIAPEVVEEYERRLLEADEARAAAKSRFTIQSDGAGMMRGTFRIPELAGAMLKKHLDALAAPKHRAAVGNESPAAPRVARPLRMGEAFQEYITSRPVGAGGLPNAGGVPATIVVTMTYEALTGALESAGTLDTGERISAAAARTLACQAGIIPAVLGGKSQVLDLGRKARFHTEPQRIAVGLRDKGCAAQDCDWPPGMCHVHHRTPWSRGGGTNIDDAVMLCPRHHALAHDTHYRMGDTGTGKIRFVRRT